jgi:hypothetical protein
MLWWKKGVLSCAVMQASCCHDPQNAMEEGCAIPALPCKLAAVVIHRMLWCKEGYPIPALSCKTRCCHDPQNSGGKVPALPYEARCCCDSQNALVEGASVLAILRCHACKLLS